jgi:hypothetical protein
MKTERDRLAQLLQTDSDFVGTIADLLAKQRDFESHLRTGGAFLAKVVNLVTGTTTAVELPLRQAQEKDLLKSVSEAKSQAEFEHIAIERVLKSANSMGYTGTDLAEAWAFLVDRMVQAGKEKGSREEQRSASDLGRIRASHAQEIAKLKDRLAQLKSGIAEQVEASNRREEQLGIRITELEKQNRELTESVQEERQVREQLGRIGAGFSADSSWLRSKMTENELHLLQFVEEMVKQDTLSRELLQRQRVMRQSLLGGSQSA